MDPDAALAVLHSLCHQVEVAESHGATEGHWQEIATQFRAHVEALDQWMQMGGFAPAEWSRHV